MKESWLIVICMTIITELATRTRSLIQLQKGLHWLGRTPAMKIWTIHSNYNIHHNIKRWNSIKNPVLSPYSKAGLSLLLSSHPRVSKCRSIRVIDYCLDWLFFFILLVLKSLCVHPHLCSCMSCSNFLKKMITSELSKKTIKKNSCPVFFIFSNPFPL